MTAQLAVTRSLSLLPGICRVSAIRSSRRKREKKPKNIDAVKQLVQIVAAVLLAAIRDKCRYLKPSCMTNTYARQFQG